MNINIEEKIIGTTCYADIDAVSSKMFFNFLFVYKNLLVENNIKIWIPSPVKSYYDNIEIAPGYKNYEATILANNNLEILENNGIVNYFGSESDEPAFCLAKQFISALGTQKISYFTANERNAKEFDAFNKLVKPSKGQVLTVIDLS